MNAALAEIWQGVPCCLASLLLCLDVCIPWFHQDTVWPCGEAMFLLTWSLHKRARRCGALQVNSLLYLGAKIPAAKCISCHNQPWHMDKWVQQPASTPLHGMRVLQTQEQPGCIFRLFLSRVLITGFDFSGLKLHFCLLSEGKKNYRSYTCGINCLRTWQLHFSQESCQTIGDVPN